MFLFVILISSQHTKIIEEHALFTWCLRQQTALHEIADPTMAITASPTPSAARVASIADWSKYSNFVVSNEVDFKMSNIMNVVIISGIILIHFQRNWTPFQRNWTPFQRNWMVNGRTFLRPYNTKCHGEQTAGRRSTFSERFTQRWQWKFTN